MLSDNAILPWRRCQFTRSRTLKPLKKPVVFYKSKEDGSWPYLDTNVFLRSNLFTLIDFSRLGSLEKKSN
uniref:Uncharacterized protein n=1 Tax=Caenorhabditis japonica TaxID=281687 RepID=A0A8R1HU73_CAEJA